MSETISEPRIQSGQRVRCEKNGPFNGLKGNVVEVLSGHAFVDFDNGASTIEPVNAFERTHE